MKRLTMTYDDDIYYPLYNKAKEKGVTMRSVVMSILQNEIYKPKEIINLGNINKDIKECIYLLDKVLKKQSQHYNLSAQHFVNHGYLSNASLLDSKSYKDFLKKDKNLYND